MNPNPEDTTTPAPAPASPILDLNAVPTRDQVRAKIEWRDGIIVDMVFVPRSVLQQLAREATTHKYDKVTRSRQPEVDGKKLAAAFAKKVVRGWEGLTLKKAADLIPLNITGQRPETVVSFTPENLEKLVTECYDFDVFLQNTAMDLSAFNADHPEETKN